MLDSDDGFEPHKPMVRRTEAERAAIVAESYKPRVTAGSVARQHGIAPSQLSGWRSAARRKSVSNTVSSHLVPVLDHLAKELKSSTKLFMDETRCPVLDPKAWQNQDGLSMGHCAR